MENRTLRFNECVCAPYNADFDGDEMNIHIPQTEEARAEANTLLNVCKNLQTPKSGEPLVAATQDFLTASFLITQKDQFFDRAEFFKMCGYFADAAEHIDIPPPAILKPVELWTGKQLMNLLIRPNKKTKIFVNIQVEEKNYTNGEEMCKNDGYVHYVNSELISGNLGKKTLGDGSKKGLFYSLIRDYSGEIAAECMMRLSKFTSRWLSNYGMTIGISDVTPMAILTSEKAKLIEEKYACCDELIQLYHDGKLEKKAGCDMEQTLESRLNGELSEIRQTGGEILQRTLPRSNSPLIMALSGSKGSNLNMSQMISTVGQQTVCGSRMPDGFFNRSLPHFKEYSKEPAAKGFVKNSFYDGLTATEFFFHTVGGREGLVDTAVKTAETGYMQRRLMKSLEDLSVAYDYSVRTSSQEIVQFEYGDDTLEPICIEANHQPANFN